MELKALLQVQLLKQLCVYTLCFEWQFSHNYREWRDHLFPCNGYWIQSHIHHQNQKFHWRHPTCLNLSCWWQFSGSNSLYTQPVLVIRILKLVINLTFKQTAMFKNKVFSARFVVLCNYCHSTVSSLLTIYVTYRSVALVEFYRWPECLLDYTKQY